MLTLQKPTISTPRDCEYLPGRLARTEYFLAQEVLPAELDMLLESGWRKFGYLFFRPACGDCRACVPLRIPVANFLPSKSQRRTIRKGAAMAVTFKRLELNAEVFAVFSDHAKSRFNQTLAANEFVQSFYLTACPGLQSEYRLDDALVAAGFLDRSERGLSSVYFAFRATAASYRPGVLSVLAEIEYAGSWGLEYCYLGYWIAANPRMAYKAAFRPHQLYDWESRVWRDAASCCGPPA